MSFPRLDLLIYAHDGRGLGHASRSIAIGMAMRCLYPDFRILFVSGSKQTAFLLGNTSLDWIKLPSYETIVIDGKSKGIKGNSNFSDQDLGRFRREAMRQIINLYRPRCVLVDHSPQGKHKELLSALEDSRNNDIRWILGLRGIVGGVSQLFSGLAKSVFSRYYHTLFWYGDSTILQDSHKNALEMHFDTVPIETGYISRLSELVHWEPDLKSSSNRLAGTISIPWIGEHTMRFLSILARAVKYMGAKYGDWRIFIGFDGQLSNKKKILSWFKGLHWCRIEPAGNRYPYALFNSRIAVIYGGYNSLMDTLYAQKPAVVIQRGMNDIEQEKHIALLNHYGNAGLAVLNEKKAEMEDLVTALEIRLGSTGTNRNRINLDGARASTRYLAEIIKS
jgi:predicted glycosyltransferase